MLQSVPSLLGWERLGIKSLSGSCQAQRAPDLVNKKAWGAYFGDRKLLLNTRVDFLVSPGIHTKPRDSDIANPTQTYPRDIYS